MYEQYLCQLLRPVGIYDLSEGTVNRAELYALGKTLDGLGSRIERMEREALLTTAEDEGLSQREDLFARRPVAVTPEERREALMALMQIDGDSLTPSEINHAITGCGIRAKAIEIDSGHLQVRFPDVAGIPPEFEQIQGIILDILPCHLEIEFYFRYLLWEECHRRGYTWVEVEAARHTWLSFQTTVPKEE